MKKLSAKIWLLLVACTLIFSAIPVTTGALHERAAETYPTVSVKIHRIAKVDAIEGSGEGGADWYYHVGVSENGTSYIWQSSAEPVATGSDDLIVDVTYTFTNVKKTMVYVAITLCEDDYWTNDDLADISSDTSGGSDNVASSIQPPTTGVWAGSYLGYYYLKTNTLGGETVYIEQGWNKTSGDYDDSTGTDENDANVWFNVWDNYNSPTANAGSDKSVYTNELVNFDGGNSYASPGSSLTRYQWDFNNDGVYDAEGQTTSHTYTTKGTYTVTLKVTDSLGETDTDTCIVTVLNRAPTAAFTYSPTSPSTATTIQFTDTSTDPDGTIASWSWSFGDGATSTSKDPTHKYSDDGTYTVTLTVTDNDGGTDTKSKQITVLNVAPVATFTYSPENPTVLDTIQFTDTSTDSDGTVVSWSWDFGDGYSSTENDPTHKYGGLGTYTVKLTVIDDDGAQNITSKSITILNAAPTSVTLSAPLSITTNSMVLTWTQNTDGDFARYEVYQSTSAGSLGSLIYTTTTQTQTSYTVTGLSAGITYYFTVRVVDSGGLHTDSNQISGTTSSAPQEGISQALSRNIIPILVAIIIIVAVVVALLLIRKKKK